MIQRFASGLRLNLHFHTLLLGAVAVVAALYLVANLGLAWTLRAESRA